MHRILLLLFPLIGSGVLAQNRVYRSYAEYAANKGEQVDGPFDVVPDFGRLVLQCSKAGAVQHIPVRKLWGFTYHGFLYRIEPQGRLPVRLMAQGAIFYWENGIAHLRMQRDSTEAAQIEHGYASYLSRDVQSEIVPARFLPEDTRSPSARFKKAWPAYADLLEHIGDGNDMERVRQLVVEYEVAVEEGRLAGPGAPASSATGP
jgi:hypothetical protein